MLTIRNLTVQYGNHIVIDNLNLALDSNKVHGLVGLNGSGKSTLLRTVYGLKTYENGEIVFDGKLSTKKEIAFLETENFFFSRITGYEFLRLFQQRNPRFNIEEWNKLFELPLFSLIETYSTGMKKKLAFLSVICLNKPCIILDEPFNGIDLETSQIIKAVIKELVINGKTIIVTSHILETLTSVCDTISYLKSGKIQFTYERAKFTELESEIFHEFQESSKKIIKGLLSN